MDQALNSQKTPHTSPLRASYGMSFVSILMKNDRVIKGFYCNGTCSRSSDVAGKSFQENDFKIDYLFYTTNIGGQWYMQSYFTSYCEERLGIGTWI